MKLTEAQREFAAELLALRMMTTEWQSLSPFTRAKYRTAILTMERIFDEARSGRLALEQNEKEG